MLEKNDGRGKKVERKLATWRGFGCHIIPSGSLGSMTNGLRFRGIQVGLRCSGPLISDE